MNTNTNTTTTKRGRTGSADGKTPVPELPEAMIQHIQSCMSAKEAARTTLLSKSWHSAWLTRPILDFDERNFRRGGVANFEKFATEAMRRYRELGFKIESFRLYSCVKQDFCRKLIVEAMQIGATDLQLEMDSFALPTQVLRSQTLVKLSLTDCTVEGSYVVTCPALKSLTFNNVTFTTDDDVFHNILTSCNASIEELSLSSLFGFSFSRMSRYELQKLRRLFLSRVGVLEVYNTVFSKDFASIFPCLEEMSILECDGCTRICIASTSLQIISYEPCRNIAWLVKFDVPNIRKFTYSGWGSPASKLSIKAEASREWEFDISIHCNQLYKSSWFLNLKKYLTKYRLSRISLFVNIVKAGYRSHQWFHPEQEVEVEVAPKPLVVENMMIDGPPSYRCALLLCLFGICRPKFITHCPDRETFPLDFLCERQTMFEQYFGLTDVKMEVLPSDASQTLANKQKIRHHLIWNE